MIAQSGCNAECLVSGGECWGCRGPITREDILERAFARYKELGFDVKDVVSKAEIYWNSAPGFATVKKVAERVAGRG
jgi:hypothetical protein